MCANWCNRAQHEGVQLRSSPAVRFSFLYVLVLETVKTTYQTSYGCAPGGVTQVAVQYTLHLYAALNPDSVGVST